MDIVHVGLQRDKDGKYITTDTEFLNKYRMKRDSFFAIANKIRNNEAFVSKNNVNGTQQQQQQHPPEFKLLILLRFLGSIDSFQNDDWMNDFMIDKATVLEYQEQALQAILSLKDDVSMGRNGNGIPIGLLRQLFQGK